MERKKCKNDSISTLLSIARAIRFGGGDKPFETEKNIICVYSYSKRNEAMIGRSHTMRKKTNLDNPTSCLRDTTAVT